MKDEMTRRIENYDDEEFDSLTYLGLSIEQSVLGDGVVAFRFEGHRVGPAFASRRRARYVRLSWQTCQESKKRL